jgi:antitoxin (DNA-binding transcriptional repressor) of toxin-antitoxin stability system
VFYVKDDPTRGFVKNAFTLDVLDDRKNGWFGPQQPGISFFDREDQLDLFKLHLPYIWRTPPQVDALFLPVINRSSRGLTMLSGLVETDWYASQVNLVFGQSPAGHSVHVNAGEPVAQIIFLPRSHRRPSLKVLASHARVARDLRTELAAWYRQHAADRSAYRKLARSQHGRMHEPPSPTNS